MLRLFAIIGIGFGCLAAQAKENWEICLDNADFRYNHDTFTEGTYTAKKEGCRVSLAASIGRGERFEINLCDPLIHLVHYPSVDSSTSGVRVIAPPGACSSPGFGADFEENAREIQEFTRTRRNALTIFDKIKQAYAPKADQAKIDDPKAFTGTESANAKLACGQLLLKTYLIQCEAFEQKKGGSAPAAVSEPPQGNAPPPPPGIHPQTILPKK